MTNTDTTEATTAADTASTAAETTEEQTDTSTAATEHDTANPQAAKARKEAANYRERLRSTEGERDTARTQVETLQRQIIDGQVEALGIKPAALWASGADLADLLSDDGSVDSDLVTEAATAARDTLGLPRFTGSGDGGRGKSLTPAAPGPENWGSLLKTP